MTLHSMFLLAMALGTASDPSDAASPRTPARFAIEQSAVAWLTSAQIDRNPYLWQGQRVAVVLRLQRMIDPANALVRQLGADSSPVIVLGNVTPETFRQTAIIAVVQIDAERTSVHGFEQPLSSARLVATFPCIESECYNWVNADVPWGQPLVGR